ncbi:hypothetical protein [Variovorax atrisoli]|uniref:hypothetical protein n=1 Tax=Variovorax atrisoli TaxID=3394203 RepID=UPI0016185022|nr:hypothetical protein [Variovorax sp. BK613]MBB3641461.1 hypothetical protein [Variovorax sp. BK613]
MNSIDYALFRSEFRTALGEDGYRRFVAAGTARRLRYWQEVELKKFFALHPERQLDMTQLADALRVCELHDGLLQSEVVEVIDGCIDYSQTYLDARRGTFPHAAADPVSTEGRMDMPTLVSVWYCAACRAARSAWMNEPP